MLLYGEDILICDSIIVSQNRECCARVTQRDALCARRAQRVLHAQESNEMRAFCAYLARFYCARWKAV